MDTNTHPDHNHTARGAGVVGLGAIALIHLLDLQGKLSETPYLGIAYSATASRHAAGRETARV